MVNSVSVEDGDGSDLFPIQTTQGGAPTSFWLWSLTLQPELDNIG